MKSYRNESLRKAKTDKIDSRIIANYGIDHWFKMKEFQTSGEIYEELKLLGQQYRHYMKLHLLSLGIDPSFRFDHAWNKESSCKLE